VAGIKVFHWNEIGNGGNHVNGLSEGFKHKLVKDRCLIAEVA
jgi:hypothetical protein